ncbi:MAG: AAA family ATPase, partial [Candidatus Odinarchaeia archaeon]
STICKKLKEQIDGIVIQNYGDLIVELSKKMFPDLIKEREDVRKIPREHYKAIQIGAAKKLSDIKDTLVIDTHLSLKTPRGYYAGLTHETLKIINPDIFLLLEFNPKDVVFRRNIDKKNGKRLARDTETEIEIANHQNINRMYAVSYAARSQSYFKIIDLTWEQEYPFQHTEFAVSQIKKLLEE